MTTTSRFLFASLILLALTVSAMGSARDSHAAPLFSVSLASAADTAPAGSDGVFIVRLQTSDTAFPGLIYDVEGGEITGTVSLNFVGNGLAEGAVHVRRETPGIARLTASFAGQVLATGELRFAEMGAVTINVSLDAGPDAAARTWLFEVTNASGAVVGRVSAGTSGDAPTGSATTALLPYGVYGIRQVLGNDTKLNCSGGAFYQVTAPVSGATTLELAAANATAAFAISLCDGAPAHTSVSIPVDPAQPALGDALPGETPISEVRGTRQAGPGAPLPPNTGSGLEAASDSSTAFSPLLIALGVAFLAASPLASSTARNSRR
jgi:hypothetical protein